MVYLIIGFILGFFVSKYMNDKQFKDKTNASFKNWLKGNKKQ